MARSIGSQIRYCCNDNFSEGTQKRAYKMEHGREMDSHIYSYSEKFRLINTGKNLQNYLREFYPEIKMVKQITPEHIQSFLNHKADIGCTSNTIQTHYCSLKKIQLVCEKTFGIKLDWKDNIVRPASNHEKSSLRGVDNQMPVEVYQCLEKYIKSHISSESGQVVLLQNKLGLRAEEILRIKVKNIDFANNKIIIDNAKGGKGLEREMTPNMREILKEAFKIHDKNNPDSIFLFSVKAKSVNQYLRRNEDKLGLSRHSIHNMRSMVAQNKYDQLRSEGMSMKDAANHAGRFLNHGDNRDNMLEKSYIRIH